MQHQEATLGFRCSLPFGTLKLFQFLQLATLQSRQTMARTSETVVGASRCQTCRECMQHCLLLEHHPWIHANKHQTVAALDRKLRLVKLKNQAAFAVLLGPQQWHCMAHAQVPCLLAESPQCVTTIAAVHCICPEVCTADAFLSCIVAGEFSTAAANLQQHEHATVPTHNGTCSVIPALLGRLAAEPDQ